MLKALFNFCKLSFLMLVFFSCGTSNNTLFNKEYHALTTKYNVLFNGKEAFSVGESILEQAFEDNFYNLISIEPINLRGENIDETSIVPGFDRAEEKAVKAIQKHSIKINELQYNRQMDEAYLLLGKARYFDRRFFPALEAFNYLLEMGAKRSVFVEGKIWREKTNIRLQNHELAIQNLRPLARSLSSKSKHFHTANATLADAFIQLKKLDSALVYIKRAAIKAPKRKTKARYLFITAQLFERLNQKDSAQWAYQEVIKLKRKAPRSFFINAKIKNTLLQKATSFENRINQIERLIKNFENQPFEHILNRTLGNLYFEHKLDSLALIHFNHSLESSSIDIYTQVKNYQDLIEYNFEKGNYIKTGVYLDKLLPLFDESTIDYKKTKRKRDNLSEVIAYEKIIKETDSLIKLMSLSTERQYLFFKNHLKNQEAQAQKALNAQTEKTFFKPNNKTKSSFYFYNQKLILQGRQAYRANWGNRPNLDNWRSSAAIQNNINQNNLVTSIQNKIQPLSIIKETPESFVSSLPKTQLEKDSIISLNQKAYLQLGMIYKEKFIDYSLARKRLEALMSLNPPSSVLVQVLYHLYRMDQKENPKQANIYKMELIKNFPDTPFGRLLEDKENYDSSGVITPEILYSNVLSLFENQEFNEALDKMEGLKVLISGSELEPKVALLKAHTLGRLNGVKEWKKALAMVATNFSAVEEGLRAKELIEQIETYNDLEERGVIYKNYKWVFPFERIDKENASKFYNEIKKALETSNSSWSVSQDPYNKNYIFIVVHGIRDPQEVENWKHKNTINDLEIETKDNFVALSAKYRSYIINKNWINQSK